MSYATGESKTINQSDTVIRIRVERVTFQNTETHFAVLQASREEQEKPITVVGTIPNPQSGNDYLIRGHYIEHRKFGKQFQATSITPIEPTTEAGMKRFLGSGVVPGIGEKMAERIVSKFGVNAIKVICQEPERITEVRGIGEKKADELHDAFQRHQTIQEITRFLIEHEVSAGLAERIHDQFGAKAVEILHEDPYLLTRKIRGVGFKTADTIALKLGFDPNSPQRLKAGLHYALERGQDDGHCFLPEDYLFRQTGILLGLGDFPDFENFLSALERDKFIIREDGCCYLKRLYDAESFVSKFIAERAINIEQAELNNSSIEKHIQQTEDALKIVFSDEQRKAVELANKASFLVITGGPGCGKTTLVRALSHMFQASKKTLALTAPTGRAAQRLSQVCDYPASTIHRLLKYDPFKRTFTYGIDNPLKVDGEEVDVIIIDETSMVDINLAKDLFSALPLQTSIILVGDQDQLPSVGPGRVFGDLVEMDQIPTAHLTQIFRRSEDSHINTVAHLVNSGTPPKIPEPDGHTKSDVYFIARNKNQQSGSVIESLVARQLKEKFGFGPSEVTVLTPTNKGPLGTITLNRRLQEAINAPSPEQKTELSIGETIFRVGDRVCQRVNNYNIDDSGVFNGDTGVITDINKEEQTLDVKLWDGRSVIYKRSEAGQLALAYALTVHRSQGSEYPCVVLALDDSHYILLERQLLYTAITRAKKLLIIVGTRRALQLATRRANAKKRQTKLTERILSFY